MHNSEDSGAALEPVLDWTRLEVGRAFPAAPCVLDDGFVDAYLQASGESHALFRRADEAGAAKDAGYAPPLCTSLVRFTKASLGGRWPSGTLQLGQRIHCLRALRRGERLSVGLSIGSLGERDGRRTSEAISTVRDQAGNAVCEQQMSLMWPLPAATPRASSGARTQAAAQQSEPQGPRTGPRIGPRIGPVSDRYTMARVRAYAAVAGARDPIHIDPAFAQTTPLGVNIAQGKLVMALISRLMLGHLGSDWLERGSLDIRFRRPVKVDEPVQAWAVASGSGEFSVWCENASGERVIAGTARA